MKTLIEEYFGFVIEVLYAMIFIKGFMLVLEKLVIK